MRTILFYLLLAGYFTLKGRFMFRVLGDSFLLLALGALPSASIYAQGNRGNLLKLTDTDKILLNLSTLERSVNEQNADWFLAHFSPSYSDTNRTKYSQIKSIIQDFLAKVSPNRKVPLFYIDNPKVTIHRDLAGVTCKILINGKQIGRREPLFLKSEDRITFRKEGGRWKIIRAGSLLKLLQERK